MLISILATVATTPETLSMDGHGSLWQAIGGLAVVFALLMLFLKFLGRFNRQGSSQETQLLTVWHLGPKREIQVLRLGDRVHYIYRHEGSMVVLQEEPYEQFLALHPEDNRTGPPASRIKQILGERFSYHAKQATA